MSLFEKHSDTLVDEYYYLNISILQELNNQYPNIKKVLSSVFGFVPLIRRAAMAQGAYVLLKPYDSEELEQVIEQALSIRLG